MNFKKIYFLVSICLIFFFTLSLILYLNHLLIFEFDFIDNRFILSFLLAIFGLIIFLILSSKVLKPIFQSEEKIKDSIKNTLHELNIPTSTIKINVSMLQKSLQDKKDLARVERISQANDNLFKLYSNMEYELKKEIDRIDLEVFNLEDIINESLLKFDDIKKDTIIELEIKNILIHSDYNGFIIVLDNLISNAIKYNDKDNPYIKISFSEGILSIFNKGEKIDAKSIIMVFDRYFQSSHLNDGFGLGLAIVKEFCDKNGILINIETVENGNRFNLNLKNILVGS